MHERRYQKPNNISSSLSYIDSHACYYTCSYIAQIFIEIHLKLKLSRIEHGKCIGNI